MCGCSGVVLLSFGLCCVSLRFACCVALRWPLLVKYMWLLLSVFGSCLDCIWPCFGFCLAHGWPPLRPCLAICPLCLRRCLADLGIWAEESCAFQKVDVCVFVFCPWCGLFVALLSLLCGFPLVLMWLFGLMCSAFLWLFSACAVTLVVC